MAATRRTRRPWPAQRAVATLVAVGRVGPTGHRWIAGVRRSLVEGLPERRAPLHGAVAAVPRRDRQSFFDGDAVGPDVRPVVALASAARQCSAGRLALRTQPADRPAAGSRCGYGLALEPADRVESLHSAARPGRRGPARDRDPLARHRAADACLAGFLGLVRASVEPEPGALRHRMARCGRSGESPPGAPEHPEFQHRRRPGSGAPD